MQKASRHHAAHFVIGTAVVAAGAASTLAATYQVYLLPLPDPLHKIAAGIAAILTAALSLSPLFLAAPFGDTKTKTRWHILALTAMIMVCDGALQINAINTAAGLLGHTHVNHFAVGIVIALFQAATFFLRGALNQAANERQAEIDAAALAIKQEQTRQQELADNRERRKKRERAKRREHLRSIQGGKV